MSVTCFIGRRTKRLLLFVTLCLLPMFQAAGQGKIYTRKARLADFPTKTTKVVLSGNGILDLSLKEEIMSRWRVSPFEFCEAEEFASLKGKSGYYFLYISEDNSGLAFLTLLKGGGKGSFQSLDSSLEVISVPFAPAQMSTGRELVFLPAMIDIVQAYVEEATMSETKSYLGLGIFNGNLVNERHKSINISRSDIADSVPGKDSLEAYSPGLLIKESEAVDRLFVEGDRDRLIGFCVAPSEPSSRARSYQMIIGADTHTLYYFSSHRYRKSSDRGFRKQELQEIRREHKYKAGKKR